MICSVVVIYHRIWEIEKLRERESWESRERERDEGKDQIKNKPW